MFCVNMVYVMFFRGQESEDKLVVTEGGTTWAEQTDAEEKAAAAERQVYFVIFCLQMFSFLNFVFFWCSSLPLSYFSV